MTQHQVGKTAGGWNKRKQKLQWLEQNKSLHFGASCTGKEKKRKKENELAIFSQFPVKGICQLDMSKFMMGVGAKEEGLKKNLWEISSARNLQ